MAMQTSPIFDQTAIEEAVRAALGEDSARIPAILAGLHPADVATLCQHLNEDESPALLNALPTEQRAEVLSHLGDIDEERVEEYLEGQTVEQIAKIVDEMEPDDAVDLLASADQEKAEAVIGQLDHEDAQELRELRKYAPDSAGGIMTPEFIQATPTDSAAEVLARIRDEYEEVENVQCIFVCGAGGRLLGSIPVGDLLAASPSERAGELMDRAVVQVGLLTDQEVCAKLMTRYDIDVLPVVDESNRLEGIITADDILDVQADEAEEDMFRLVGVGDSKPLEHPYWERALKRLPWLVATLLGMGLFGPLILHKWFSGTLEEIVVLAFFVPAVMGLSGSAATQSATITVRGLATDEIAFSDFFWMLRREMAVAGIIAVVCALTMMVFAYVVTAMGMESAGPNPSTLGITGTIGLSMVAGIFVGAMLGVSIPMLCHRVGVDPAVASGPFITTAIDIAAQVIYLGLATWLLTA